MYSKNVCFECMVRKFCPKTLFELMDEETKIQKASLRLLAEMMTLTRDTLNSSNNQLLLRAQRTRRINFDEHHDELYNNYVQSFTKSKPSVHQSQALLRGVRDICSPKKRDSFLSLFQNKFHKYQVNLFIVTALRSVT